MNTFIGLVTFFSFFGIIGCFIYLIFIRLNYGKGSITTQRKIPLICCIGIFIVGCILIEPADTKTQQKQQITQVEQQTPIQEEKKEIPPQVQSVMDSTNVDEAQAEKIVSVLQQCGAGDFTITNSSSNADGKTYEISSNGKILALALLANNAIGNVTYDGQVLYNSKTNAVEHTISDIDASRQKTEEQARQQAAAQSSKERETTKPARTYSGQGPNGETIKGNINKGKKIYHVPGGAYYDRTDPEEWFFTEEEAQAAGYRPSSR